MKRTPTRRFLLALTLIGCVLALLIPAVGLSGNSWSGSDDTAAHVAGP